MSPVPEVLYAIGLAVGLLIGAYHVLVRHQGDCDAVVEVDRARDFVLRVEGDTATAHCLVPLTNRGKQDGMVVELLCEASHPGQVRGRPKIVPFCVPQGVDEDEGWYWKALLLHHGQTLLLRMGATITFRSQEPGETLSALLEHLPGLTLRVHCKTIGRRSITWRLSELVLPLDNMARTAA